ncbi:hypothetical protein CAAN1_02S01024 [[Candida] anglica]|uniref:RRM domain-containing protein n=1 Tax=[Candida] anglica TaxID=148631 RepID=A0ABP0E6T2_9ASCO
MSIIASRIPKTVTTEKLTEFFSFCGKIKAVNPIKSTEEKFQSVEVIFESEKALQTALLLNEAELDGVAIKVVQAESGGLPSYSEAAPSGGVTHGDHKFQNDALATGDNTYDDVSQEEKPKYAIMAQLLASGYVVSDKLIDQAIKTDSEKGYSAKFMSFLENLDKKWIHSQEPQSTANKTTEQVSSKLTEWTNAFSKSGYKTKLDHYYEQATAHPYGKKVSQFYKQVAKDAKDVHAEARRLAELKKSQSTPTESTPSSTTATPAETIKPKPLN